MLGSVDLRLIFSGRSGSLACGASLCTRLVLVSVGDPPEQHVWEHFQLCRQTQTQVTAFRLYHRETQRKLNVICPLHSRLLPDQTLLIRAEQRAPEGWLMPVTMPSELWRLSGNGLAHSQGFLCQAGFTLAWSPALDYMAAVAQARGVCVSVGRKGGRGRAGSGRRGHIVR